MEQGTTEYNRRARWLMCDCCLFVYNIIYKWEKMIISFFPLISIFVVVVSCGLSFSVVTGSCSPDLPFDYSWYWKCIKELLGIKCYGPLVKYLASNKCPFSYTCTDKHQNTACMLLNRYLRPLLPGAAHLHYY